MDIKRIYKLILKLKPMTDINLIKYFIILILALPKFGYSNNFDKHFIKKNLGHTEYKLLFVEDFIVISSFVPPDDESCGEEGSDFCANLDDEDEENIQVISESPYENEIDFSSMMDSHLNPNANQNIVYEWAGNWVDISSESEIPNSIPFFPTTILMEDPESTPHYPSFLFPSSNIGGSYEGFGGTLIAYHDLENLVSPGDPDYGQAFFFGALLGGHPETNEFETTLSPLSIPYLQGAGLVLEMDSRSVRIMDDENGSNPRRTYWSIHYNRLQIDMLETIQLSISSTLVENTTCTIFGLSNPCDFEVILRNAFLNEGEEFNQTNFPGLLIAAVTEENPFGISSRPVIRFINGSLVLVLEWGSSRFEIGGREPLYTLLDREYRHPRLLLDELVDHHHGYDITLEQNYLAAGEQLTPGKFVFSQNKRFTYTLLNNEEEEAIVVYELTPRGLMKQVQKFLLD